MKSAFTVNEVLAEVQRLVAEVLSLDPREVKPAALIMLELGAESIDLLDLRFRTERAFGLKITNAELAQAIVEGVAGGTFQDRFTVQAMADYVARRLNEQNG